MRNGNKVPPARPGYCDMINPAKMGIAEGKGIWYNMRGAMCDTGIWNEYIYYGDLNFFPVPRAGSALFSSGAERGFGGEHAR